jgi:DNA-binding SARP family transcriptional activator
VALDFGLLGPLDVRDGELSIELPKRKPRALLGALLLRVGETVSTDRLVEALWGERPPRTARDALQNNVVVLRKALGPEVLLTQGTGYVLDVRRDQIDVARFDDLLGKARATDETEERARTLREALTLWRGPALADLVYEPFAALEAPRLDALRLAATQDLVDAELELGQASDLVPELEALIQEHPFDERLCGQLMLALYRSGRQADALECYRAARRLLADELGLEPGPTLRELEQAILRHDDHLGAGTSVASAASLRTATVLFAGVDDAAASSETVARLLTQAGATVDRHGGRTTFLGDSVMGVFGVPRSHEDDPLRAVRTAAEVREALPGARVALATGEVFASGEVVTGAPMTQARRLQWAARRGETVVDPSTLRLVRDAVRVQRRKRSGETVFLFDELIAGAPALGRRLDAPLVGRTAELTRLRQAFEQVRDRRRCVVFGLVGDAGIGKTRLAQELITSLGAGATLLVGRCVSYGEGSTYLPLREIVGEGFELLLDSAGSIGELFLSVRQHLEGLAAERPLVLVFEDLHWAAPTLIDFVDYLGSKVEGSSILALCLARPELLAERAGWTRGRDLIVLEPLSDEQSLRLLGDTAHAARIVEIAEGNPLYVEQLVAYAREGGGEALEAVPGSIEGLIAGRLDRLEDGERELAQRAAVVGRLFSRAALSAMGPVDALAGLETAGLVHRGTGAGYRFHHALVRDVAYSGTPMVDRAELHERHADWLDGRPEGSDELIGYHLEQAAGYQSELGAPAGRIERLATGAGRRLGSAGIGAWKRGDVTTTVDLLDRATALLPELDTGRLELMCELGVALRTGGELARAESTLASALDAASGERRVELRARLELANVRLYTDSRRPVTELVEAAREAIPVFEAIGDDRALGRAWHLVASAEGPTLGHYETAALAERKALVHYDRSGWPGSTCLAVLGSTLYFGPMPVPEAIRECERLLEDAELSGKANVLAYLGGLESMRKRTDEGRALVQEARSIFAELGMTAAAEIVCGAVESEIELDAGDAAKALSILLENHRALERMGDRAFLSTRETDLADACYRTGHVEDAGTWADEAERHASADDRLSTFLRRSVQAKIAARRGDSLWAETLIDEALQLGGQMDTLSLRGRVLLALAEVRRLAGREVEAVEAIDRAARLFEQKGDIASLDRAADERRALTTEGSP